MIAFVVFIVAGFIGYHIGREDERMKQNEAYCHRVLKRAIREQRKKGKPVSDD